MLAMTILSVFIFFIVLLVFLEYRNEKKYQEGRRRKRQQTTPVKNSALSQEKKKTAPKPEPKPEEKPEEKVALEPEPKTEALKETKELPEANYPKFTHIRLVEMGISEAEAKEFVSELIPQIETQFPLIEKAIQASDFRQIEQLTHGIKGSATNLGTGGVSDLLVDYNTYLKTGTDRDIAKAYFEHLKHYNDALKAQYA